MSKLRTLFRQALLAAALLLTAQARADHQRPHILLGAQLNGAQEVPAVNTPARGVASFTFNNNRDTLYISAAFNGLSGPVTVAHVHDGARGVIGGIVTNLTQFVTGNRLRGFLTGSDIDQAKISKYLRGEYYINVHTTANPGGEIRGQIEVDTDQEYAATLNGAQEVPAVSTTATGLGTFNLSKDQSKLKFRVVATGLSGAITLAHFHTGAVGVTGPPVVDLLPFTTGNVIEGEITPNAAFLTALNARQIYVNIHTAANPNGEVRGQVLPVRNGLPHDARLDGSQMVPAVTTNARGVAFARLNATLDSVRLTVAYTGLSGAPTNLSVFVADAGQANGSTPFATIPLPAGSPNPITVAIGSLTAPAVNVLLQGGANIVLTTAANPNGEIRGQVYRLAREGYTFAMNGQQEAPNPVNTPGYGTGYVSMDRDQSNVYFSMVWGGLSGPATVAHFHTGLFRQPGPFVFDLAPFYNTSTNAVAAEGFWLPTNPAPNSARPFTARRALQFRRDSMYVNIHTAANPGGEIRGQVFRGARNLSRVLSARPATLVAESFQTYPSPARKQVQLKFESLASSAGTISVTDVLGRQVLSQDLLMQPGSQQVTLEVGKLKAGLHFVTINASGTKIVAKFVKE